MTLNELLHKVVGTSTADGLQPGIGDVIAFETAGCTVFDAEVKDVDWFCDTWNYKAEFRLEGHDGKWHTMTQWVTEGQVV